MSASSTTTIPPSVYRNIPFTEPVPPTSSQSYVVASMYNYYDNSLLSSASNPIEASTNKIVFNKFGRDEAGPFMVDGQDVSAVYLDSDGAFNMYKFLNIFFSTGTYFNVSKNNANNSAISFNSQTYSSGNSPMNSFNLYNFLLDCYLETNGITRNNVDPRLLLLLRKETNKIKSLADVKGTTICTSWDAIIADLIDCASVVPDDGTGVGTDFTTAKVPLTITLNYHSFVLNIDAQIEFVYVVGIRGYRLSTSSIAQPTYNNEGAELSDV